MSSHQKRSGKTESEYATFVGALKQVLSVSHSDIKTKIAAEKRKRTRKASASRA